MNVTCSLISSIYTALSPLNALKIFEPIRSKDVSVSTFPKIDEASAT